MYSLHILTPSLTHPHTITPLHIPSHSHTLTPSRTHTLTGLLWSKQFYHYIIEAWLDGDPEQPKPPRERLFGRNASGDWAHLFNRDVVSMPDKWEYPWVSQSIRQLQIMIIMNLFHLFWFEKCSTVVEPLD